MPLHAGGSPVRSWLAVQDCASAILTVLAKGKTGAIYNVPGDTQASVADVVRGVSERLGITAFEVVGQDRPGLDTRYHVSGEPLKALGWVPQGDFWRDLGPLVERERASLRW